MKAIRMQVLLLVFLFIISGCEKDKVDKNEPYDKKITAIAIQGNIVWIGTQEGLSKYDHVEWLSYTIDNGLINNYITALACDQNNDIWVGSTEGLIKLSID